MKQRILSLCVGVGMVAMLLSGCGDAKEEVSVSDTLATESVVLVSETESAEEVLPTQTASEEETMSTEAMESTEEVMESTEVVAESMEVVTESAEATPASMEVAESTEAVMEPTQESVASEEALSGGDIEERYQQARNSWTLGATWTASNGVEIKINDAWANLASTMAAGDGCSAAIYYDGTENLEPNSSYMYATLEFVYGDKAERFTSLDVSSLPDIPCASTKQTSPPETEEWEAYKNAFNDMYGYQVSGHWGATFAYCLQNYGKGVGLVAGVSGYLWSIEYGDWDVGTCWRLEMRSNPSELQWDAIENSLRLLSPDGDALYHEFYTQFYYDNPTFPDYNMWVPIGDSQAMVGASEYYHCYFY